MGGEIVLGRELDRTRHREVRGVHRHLGAPPQRLRRLRSRHRAGRSRSGSSPSRRRRRRSSPPRPRTGSTARRTGNSRSSSVPFSGSSSAERRPAASVVGGEDPAVAQERERPQPEHPRGIAELRLRRVQHAPLTVAHALEVPPAAAIAREHELAVRAPLGLPDRLLAVAPGNLRDVLRASRPARARLRRARSRPRASREDSRRGS